MPRQCPGSQVPRPPTRTRPPVLVADRPTRTSCQGPTGPRRQLTGTVHPWPHFPGAQGRGRPKFPTAQMERPLDLRHPGQLAVADRRRLVVSDRGILAGADSRILAGPDRRKLAVADRGILAGADSRIFAGADSRILVVADIRILAVADIRILVVAKHPTRDRIPITVCPQQHLPRTQHPRRLDIPLPRLVEGTRNPEPAPPPRRLRRAPVYQQPTVILS